MTLSRLSGSSEIWGTEREREKRETKIVSKSEGTQLFHAETFIAIKVMFAAHIVYMCYTIIVYFYGQG